MRLVLNAYIKESTWNSAAVRRSPDGIGLDLGDGSDGQVSGLGAESVLIGHPVDGVRHAGLDPRVRSAHRHAGVLGVELLVESGDHLPLSVLGLVAAKIIEKHRQNASRHGSVDGLKSDWSFALPGAEAAVLVGFHGLADDSDIGGQLGGGRNGNKGEEDELFSKNESRRQ